MNLVPPLNLPELYYIPILNSEWDLLEECFALLKGHGRFANYLSPWHYVHRTSHFGVRKVDDETTWLSWPGWSMKLRYQSRPQLEFVAALYVTLEARTRVSEKLPIWTEDSCYTFEPRYRAEPERGGLVEPLRELPAPRLRIANALKVRSSSTHPASSAKETVTQGRL